MGIGLLKDVFEQFIKRIKIMALHPYCVLLKKYRFYLSKKDIVCNLICDAGVKEVCVLSPDLKSYIFVLLIIKLVKDRRYKISVLGRENFFKHIRTRDVYYTSHLKRKNQILYIDLFYKSNGERYDEFPFRVWTLDELEQYFDNIENQYFSQQLTMGCADI